MPDNITTVTSVIDLYEFVPAPFDTSPAWAMRVDGADVEIAGYVEQLEGGVNKGTRAVLSL